MATLSYRSIFISDTHLGLRAARTEYLLDFLKHIECENLFLVGDIFDIWKMKTGWHWPTINNEIIKLVLDMAQSGTRVVYIPGNHDELFREYEEFHFSGVDVRQEVVHSAPDGRRYLVMHGDAFDCVVMSNKWLAHLGGGAYDLLLWINHWFNFARRKLGFGYWSLSAYLKNQVKEAVNYIGNFEEAVIHEARTRSMDGVICGHIHHAIITDFDGITYANCGDWVESCTALAEDEEGKLHLIRWADESLQRLDNSETADANSDSDGRVVTTS